MLLAVSDLPFGQNTLMMMMMMMMNMNMNMNMIIIIINSSSKNYTTIYEEQLETKFSRETENVFTLSLL